jgi:hypothetical protein
MWLKEFLPDDVEGIRIMSYGYNSNLVGETVNDRFIDYANDFIGILARARGSDEVCEPSQS